MRIVPSALAYAASIFALGFVLGTIRVLWAGATIGRDAFMLVEIPVILAASWIAADRIARRFSIGPGRPALAMGGLAFILLMLGELLLAGSIGEGIPQWIAGMTRSPGIYGLAGQIAFALSPWLVTRRRNGW